MVKKKLILLPSSCRLYRLRIRHASRWLSLVLTVAILLFFWVGSTLTPYIGTDFSYSASMQTTVNDYDADKLRYDHDRYMLSSLWIERADNGKAGRNGSPGMTAELRSTLRTSQPDSAQAAQVTTRQFTTGVSDGRVINAGSRPAYLFAPRKLAKGASFTAWQQFYNTSAVMRYAGQQDIEGLKVFRYTTEFSSPAQGSLYRPKVTMWVEPVTGWLIKYHESTTRYAYEPASGRQGTPISHSNSNFTEATIRQQVEYAHHLKYRLDFGLHVVPSILVLSLLILVTFKLVRRLGIRHLPVEIMASLVLAAGLANLTGWLLHIRPLIVLGFGTIPLSPIAGLGFAGIALGTLLLCSQRMRRAALLLALAVTGLALINVLHSAHLISFDIQATSLQTATANAIVNAAGHLSLFGSLALLLLGGGLAMAATATNEIVLRPAKTLTGVAAILGLAGLLAKLLLLNEVFVVPEIATLSVAGSLLSFFCGVSLLQVMLSYRPYPANTVDGEFTTRGKQLPVLLAALQRPALIAVPLILLGVLAQLQQTDVKQDLQASFDKHVTVLQDAVTDKMGVYTNMLAGVKAFYTASTAVERDEWRSYVTDINLTGNYPGVPLVGFVRTTDNAQLTQTTRQLRSQGLPSFTIFPAGNRPSYDYLLYVEPLSVKTGQLIGYDVASDPVLADTLQAARSSGRLTLSGKTNLLQGPTKSRRPSFAVIVPAYVRGQAANTDGRPATPQGFVYAPFDSISFFDANIRDLAERSAVDIRVYDGFDTTDSTLLYDQVPTASHTEAKLTATKTTYVHNRPWTIVYAANDGFKLNETDKRGPSLILIGGSGVYLLCLLSALAYGVLRRQVDSVSQPGTGKRSRERL